MKKLLIKLGIGLGKTGIKIAKEGFEVGKDITKPLPLSKVVEAVKDVRLAKFELRKVKSLLLYILSGVVLWALILGKITVNDLLVILKAFGEFLF